MLMFMAARRKEAVMVVVKCCLWVRGCVKGKGCGGGVVMRGRGPM